jgi:hypothetical protein
MDKINPPGRTRCCFISKAMNATAVQWRDLTQHCAYSARIAFQILFKIRSLRKSEEIKILKIDNRYHFLAYDEKINLLRNFFNESHPLVLYQSNSVKFIL